VPGSRKGFDFLCAGMCLFSKVIFSVFLLMDML
jgi:hypothetical protein